MTDSTSTFQKAIEAVEALSPDDQVLLLNLLNKRLIQHQRDALAQEIAEVRKEYSEGNVSFGSVNDFLAELDN